MNTDREGADQRWFCNRKKAYPTLKLSSQVAARATEREGIEVVAYACTRGCGQFHIGRRIGE